MQHATYGGSDITWTCTEPPDDENLTAFESRLSAMTATATRSAQARGTSPADRQTRSICLPCATRSSVPGRRARAAARRSRSRASTGTPSARRAAACRPCAASGRPGDEAHRATQSPPACLAVERELQQLHCCGRHREVVVQGVRMYPIAAGSATGTRSRSASAAPDRPSPFR